jgi:hypothetical protein
MEATSLLSGGLVLKADQVNTGSHSEGHIIGRSYGIDSITDWFNPGLSAGAYPLHFHVNDRFEQNRRDRKELRQSVSQGFVQ